VGEVVRTSLSEMKKKEDSRLAEKPRTCGEREKRTMSGLKGEVINGKDCDGGGRADPPVCTLVGRGGGGVEGKNNTNSTGSGLRRSCFLGSSLGPRQKRTGTGGKP